MKKIAADNTFRAEAFRDPDFQNSVFEAQKAYARNGNEELKQTLIDLISQRSKQTERNRLMLTLNDAINEAASMTEEDLAILSLLFLLQHVMQSKVSNLEALAEHFRKFYDPIIPSLQQNDLAYKYLASHGCLLIGSFVNLKGPFLHLIDKYPGVITSGLTGSEIETLIPSSHLAHGLVMPSRIAPDRWVLEPGDAGDLNGLGVNFGLPANLGGRYTELAIKSRPDQEVFVKVLERFYEKARELFDLFSNPYLSGAQLTALGIALGHANLVQKCQIEADLSIWIK